MAADISEITLCNQPEILSADDAHDLLIHILIDLHDALKMLADQGRLLARHDAMLAEYRPLLDRYAHPLAAKLTRRPRG